MTPQARWILYYGWRFLKGALPVIVLGRFIVVMFVGQSESGLVGLALVAILATIVGGIYASQGDGPENLDAPVEEPSEFQKLLSEFNARNRSATLGGARAAEPPQKKQASIENLREESSATSSLASTQKSIPSPHFSDARPILFNVLVVLGTLIFMGVFVIGGLWVIAKIYVAIHHLE